ncbi:MerR family transcriptional regulator [Alicyclobacillaceae bacterium I2511]|jgi:DNA-binding transcriptional MerR regulator|nr:MerR family transcriptional regulator [Alicyclobacillaceae bacterium I2511]
MHKSTFTVEDVVHLLGVTPRTLHYYEEMGLLEPACRTNGGHRLYDDASLERIRRVLRLKDDMGSSLQEIKLILDAEQALDQLRALYRSDLSETQRDRVLDESIGLMEGMLERVERKLSRLSTLRESIVERLTRARTLRTSMTPIEQPVVKQADES